MSSLRASLVQDGYVIIPSLLTRPSVVALRAAAARTTALARSSQWPYIRTIPKQFPPWPSDPSCGIWGVQHLLHPDLADHDIFAASYFSDGVVHAVGDLLGCGEEELVMELYNLLVRPDRDFELWWHRDDVPATATAEEEREALGAGRRERGRGHAQWNLALYDDESLVVVPGSHCRPRTEAERAAGPYAVLEGQTAVRLKAGDAVFYDNNILHRGIYGSSRERMTLHGSMGRAAVESRARSVLQHGIGGWVERCDFTNLAERIGQRAERMKARLIEFGRGRTAKEVGYSHAD